MLSDHIRWSGYASGQQVVVPSCRICDFQPLRCNSPVSCCEKTHTMAAAGFTYNQKQNTNYGQVLNTNPVIGNKNLSVPTSDTNPTQKIYSNARPPTFPGLQRVVELKVPLCCQGCEDNVRFELTSLDGVNEISVDMDTQKVVVKGEIQASTVLKTVKRVLNRAEFWKK